MCFQTFSSLSKSFVVNSFSAMHVFIIIFQFHKVMLVAPDIPGTRYQLFSFVMQMKNIHNRYNFTFLIGSVQNVPPPVRYKKVFLPTFFKSHKNISSVTILNYHY